MDFSVIRGDAMPNSVVRDVYERYDDLIPDGQPDSVWVRPWNTFLDRLDDVYNWERKGIER